MISVLGTWAAVSAVLGLLVGGIGLLFRAVVPGGVRTALVLPIGFTTTLVAVDFASTAGLPAVAALVLLVVAAAFGFVVGGTRRPARTPALLWGLAAGATTWAIYTVVVASTGQLTFPGYGLSGDPAIHLVGADALLGGGGDWAQQAGSFKGFFAGYYDYGYPAGGASLVAITSAFSGLDPVATLYPVLVVAMVVFTSAVWVLLTPTIDRPWLRAIAAVLASVPAVTFSFVMMSSLKEVIAVAAIASTCATFALLFRGPADADDRDEDSEGTPGAVPAAGADRAPTAPRAGWAVDSTDRWGLVRTLVPIGFGGASVAASIGLAGGVYIAPAVVVLVLAVWVAATFRAALVTAVGIAVVTAVLVAPSLVELRSYLDVSGTVLTTQAELGTLYAGPLDLREVLGVWLGPDFRIPPRMLETTDAAGTLMIVLAAFGAVRVLTLLAVRRRIDVTPLLAWLIAMPLATYVVLDVGSPWADAKAMAIAAPTVLAGVGVGVAWLWTSRFTRIFAVAGGGLAVAAVGVSFAYAAYDTGVAPQERFAELHQIDERFEGQGPMITVEWEEFVRHALRKVPASFVGDGYAENGFAAVRYGFSGDQDDLESSQLQSTTKLVLVRMGADESRPPSNFSLAWRGRFYEVWKRDDALPVPRGHLPVGTIEDNGLGVPKCRDLVAFAAGAQDGDRLVLATRPAVSTQEIAKLPLPIGWYVDQSDTRVAHPYGRARFEFTLKASAPDALVDLWVEGSFMRRISIEVNGVKRSLGPMATNPRSSATRAATVRADADGNVHVVMVRPGRAFRAGWGNGPEFWGPVSATVHDPLTAAKLETHDPADARDLCGRTIDWAELVPAAK